MTTYNVQFRTDRQGATAPASVELPDAVPVKARNRAIQLRLQAQGYSEAHDIVILRDAVTMSAVECGGLPHNVDIAAAGY